MASSSSPDVDADVQRQVKIARRRRNNSSLGADPRGDTGVGSFATNNAADSQPVSASEAIPPATSGKSKERGRKRRKAKNAWRRFKRISTKHTWVTPLVLMLIILGAYFVRPGEDNFFRPWIFLSYANPALEERTSTLPPHIGNPTQYGKGRKDFLFVLFYTIVFSFTREFIMQRFLKPLANKVGIRRRAKQSRFMEQMYTAIYFAIFGPLGMYVMSRTPVWYFNTAGMYDGFPHRAHEALFKAYYLLQSAYWAQQALVLLLQLEKPRKDYRELVLHHIITLALIGLSYRFHFTYMGVAVYCTHDVSDFFLATSKVLNYLDSPLTGPYFAWFIVTWAYLRHYINLRILYSLFPFPIGIPGTSYTIPGWNLFARVGPYELNWVTEQYKCWISQAIAFMLLLTLQAVNLFWFFLINRILYRFVFAGTVKDERSDDEEDDGEEAEEAVAAVEKQTAKNLAKPDIQVNGEPLHTPVLRSSGVDSESEGVRRSPRKRTQAS